MSPEPTDGFTDLVLHVLAHVRLGGAGCVHDPGYRAWAQDRMPAELRQLLEHDAAVVERAWSGGRAPLVVHAWPELLGSIAELRAVSTRELRVLSASQVRAPWVLERLVAVDDPTIELLHATLCALAPWYATWREHELEPALKVAAVERVRPWLEVAAGVLPSLSSTRIELSWSLGPRGRGFPSRIVVGAPVEWNRMDPRLSAVLALHEHAVQSSGHTGYVEAEWAALTRLAARMTMASSELAQAHAQWLASLELQPLLAELHASGRIDREQQRGLADDREHRAARLAALAARE